MNHQRVCIKDNLAARLVMKKIMNLNSVLWLCLIRFDAIEKLLPSTCMIEIFLIYIN